MAFAFGIRAQTGQMQGKSSQEPAKFTGCLQSGTEPNTYILKDVKMVQAGTDKTPRQLARTESSYMLVPQGKVDLKRHVGHEVEVTGTLSENELSSQPSSNAEIKVSSIRHISDTCR